MPRRPEHVSVDHSTMMTASVNVAGGAGHPGGGPAPVTAARGLSGLHPEAGAFTSRTTTRFGVPGATSTGDGGRAGTG